jgi:hypothetical protein
VSLVPSGRSAAIWTALAPWPGAASAECLGGGCYDGLVWLFGGAVLILVLVVAAIVLMFMQRWRAVLVIGALIAVTVVVVGLQM